MALEWNSHVSDLVDALLYFLQIGDTVLSVVGNVQFMSIIDEKLVWKAGTSTHIYGHVNK